MSQICSDFLIVDAEEGNQTNNNDGVEIEEDSDDIDDEEYNADKNRYLLGSWGNKC